MAPDTSICNHLMPLCFKGLTTQSTHYSHFRDNFPSQLLDGN